MKLIIHILTVFFVHSVFAQTNLNWQKVELEEKVQFKLKSNLQRILEANQYFTEVEVVVGDPGMPNFDDLKKKGTKVSDISFDESKGDYIAFSKVGLEVPVVEESFNENQQKLKELYRYQESFDLFKNIEDVKINVFLSDLLTEDQVQFVRNIVNNLRFPIGDIKPKITFNTVKMEKKKEEPKALPKPNSEKEKEKAQKKDDQITQKDILDFISRFGNALGLILATILFGIISFLLLKKYEAIRKNFAEPKPNENQDSKTEEKKEDAAAEELIDATAESLALSSKENFARFKHFIESSRSESMILIKGWINQQSTENQMALKAIAQQLTDEELVSMFQGLNDAEREKWKDSLDSFMEDKDLATANKFICEEVVRTMIDPGKIKDLEVIDLVLNLSIDMACRFVVEKPEFGKVLMNLLNPQIISKILNKLDEDQAGDVILKSMDFDFSEITDDFAAFKTELRGFISVQKKKPFNTKIMQMVSDFNPLKENLLYNYLAKSGMHEEIIALAKQYLPFDCIQLLPKEVLKEMMQAYPMVKKVAFISVCDAGLKDVLVNAFAEPGSSARQMIEMELETLNGNKAAVARNLMQKDAILKDFVQFSRDFVQANKDYMQDIELIVSEWVKNLESDGNHLKLAEAA